MIHRDLKPANLMLTENGVLKTIDFGFAKQFNVEKQMSKNSFTLCYRPPEILLGAVHYGPAADMWSVGCILAEIIMRRPLFLG